MFNVLTALAMGIVIFAITVGVGVVVLTKFGGALSDCPTYQPFNASTDTCYNATASTDPTSKAWTTTNALNDELGTSGLAGWTAAIVALAVGLLFIGALMGKKQR